MQATSFVALTGHLNEYPLTDLISTLRRQRKTGRLLIEYAMSPCSLYFEEGHLVDAQLNNMGGLQAVLVALSQPNASFNFNPLIQPPRRSINESAQKVILELLGCCDEKTVEVEAHPANESKFSSLPPSPVKPTLIDVEPEGLPRAKEILALPASSLEQASRRRNRHVLIASAVISLMVSFFTVGVFMRWLVKRDINAALSELTKKETAAEEKVTGSSGEQTIKVLVQIENGRVARAFVEEHRDGMEAYEALALRIARARRYAATASGQDTVLIKINSPN